MTCFLTSGMTLVAFVTTVIHSSPLRFIRHLRVVLVGGPVYWSRFIKLKYLFLTALLVGAVFLVHRYNPLQICVACHSE